MKNDIHPVYEETTISCGCGNVITTKSTRKDIKVEICGACHPFYTGQQRNLNTAGSRASPAVVQYFRDERS